MVSHRGQTLVPDFHLILSQNVDNKSNHKSIISLPQNAVISFWYLVWRNGLNVFPSCEASQGINYQQLGEHSQEKDSLKSKWISGKKEEFLSAAYRHPSKITSKGNFLSLCIQGTEFSRSRTKLASYCLCKSFSDASCLHNTQDGHSISV